MKENVSGCFFSEHSVLSAMTKYWTKYTNTKQMTEVSQQAKYKNRFSWL